ncbi:hypothetical protein LXA43DRAFT_733650 [Ganoderma leucocontextum]|nr:hypothetical protein LXA43DRAFT_733650 [Ganoderma leucocontextum]
MFGLSCLYLLLFRICPSSPLSPSHVHCTLSRCGCSPVEPSLRIDSVLKASLSFRPSLFCLLVLVYSRVTFFCSTCIPLLGFISPQWITLWNTTPFTLVPTRALLLVQLHSPHEQQQSSYCHYPRRPCHHHRHHHHHISSRLVHIPHDIGIPCIANDLYPSSYKSVYHRNSGSVLYIPQPPTTEGRSARSDLRFSQPPTR